MVADDVPAASPPRRTRPLGVTVFGALFLLTSVLALFSVVVPSSDELGFLLIAAVYCVMGVAFLAGWTWAWWFTLVVSCLGVLGGLMTLTFGWDALIMFYLTYNAVITGYLFLPTVRHHFRIGRQDHASVRPSTKGIQR